MPGERNNAGGKKKEKKKRANINGFLMAVLLVQQLMH